MKLPNAVIAVILSVALVGCSSTSSRGTAGGGGQAGSSTSPGSGGAANLGTGGSIGPGSGGARPGSGGAAGISGGATGGRAQGTGGAPAGGHGGSASGGVAGGTGGASSGGGAGGMCPSGQRWCAGCTPGSGTCSAGVCPGFNCPVMDGGAPDASSDCSTATTEADCNARGVCHAVFVDGRVCGCAMVGCCTRFSTCADGATAMCSTTAVSCTLATPYCEGPYVVAYSGGCYEGCVRSSECAGGAGGTAGSGGHGGQGGASGGTGGPTGQTCSSAPPVACPGGQVCDEDTPNRCGAGSEPGHCIVMPDGCTADYVPVCGCDNHTYPNDCERQRARIQLAHPGACS